jgi:hypothetical protein
VPRTMATVCVLLKTAGEKQARRPKPTLTDPPPTREIVPTSLGHDQNVPFHNCLVYMSLCRRS